MVGNEKYLWLYCLDMVEFGRLGISLLKTLCMSDRRETFAAAILLGICVPNDNLVMFCLQRVALINNSQTADREQ
jgi:hypothetical protein